MKKVIVILSALVLCATTASAQSWLDDFLKVATEKVGDVISGKGAATTAFDIKGSWKYQGIAIGASSDDILSSLATSAGSGTIEKKCDELLAKAGIKPGVATLNFKDSTLTINFAKLFTFKLVGTIKTNATGCEILFDADKFVGWISKVLEVVNKVANNSTLGSVQSMLANAKGVKLGFKLAK